MSVTKSYNPSLKTRNDLIGEITPKVFESAPTDRPLSRFGAGFLPAPWLPVQWQDQDSKDWFTLSVGKMVSLTRDGFLAPSGYKLNWEATTSGITYTSDDYDCKTQDITTGEEYATDGTTTYTAAQITTALKSRGLIGTSETCDAFLSDTVGAVYANLYSWAGGDGLNPAFLKDQNWIKQKSVQFVTEIQMDLPLVPASHTAVSVPGSLTGSALAFGSGNLFSASNTTSKARYNQITNTDFVAWALADNAIATDTDRTPVEGSSADFLVSEKKLAPQLYPSVEEAIAAAVDSLTSAGDYFIDYQSGVIFLYVSGGATVPSNASGETITYYHYGASPASVEKYMCVVGNIKPGDRLKVDSNSNLTLWVDGTDSATDIVGRCYDIQTTPTGLISSVKTAWEGSNFTNRQQMTGSASKGFGSQIRFSGAADKLCKVVLDVD